MDRPREPRPKPLARLYFLLSAATFLGAVGGITFYSTTAITGSDECGKLAVNTAAIFGLGVGAAAGACEFDHRAWRRLDVWITVLVLLAIHIAGGRSVGGAAGITSFERDRLSTVGGLSVPILLPAVLVTVGADRPVLTV